MADSTNVASLQLRVESSEVERARNRLGELEKQGGRTEKATDGLAASFTRLLGPLAASVSAAAALTKLVAVQRQFDVLNASLVTATGSTENARIAFQALEDFAANTPYDLAQVTDSFTKLVNLGLTPSERALTSYGNTASAMGKELNQLVEAVADASTGEFERLKEFGIRASKEGDRVTFTFRGIKTQVANTTAEIEGYLMRLGENEFAGAMARRVDSLDGALSGLADEWDRVFRSVSAAGVGDVIEEGVRKATSALAELNAMLASGEMTAYLRALTGQFDAFGTDASRALGMLSQFAKENFGSMQKDGESLVDFLLGAFRNLPTNVRAFIQLLVTDFAASFDMIKAYAGAFKDGVSAIFNSDTIEGVGARLDKQLAGIKEARRGSVLAIMDERAAALQSTEDQIAVGEELRRLHNKNALARKEANMGKDRLAGFSQGGKATEGVDAALVKKQKDEFNKLVESLRTEEEAIEASYTKRRAIIERGTTADSPQRGDLMSRLDKETGEQRAKLAEDRAKDFEGLRSSLRTEEQSIEESYAKRMEIIRNNTTASSEARTRLEEQVRKDRDVALADLEAQKQRERDSLYTSLMTEEEALQLAFVRKHEMIMSNTEITELERQDLLARLQKQFRDEQEKMEMDRIQGQMKSASEMFEGLAGLAKAYAGEQSNAYRVLFAVSKAFSVAQAAMSIATGLAKAQELGFPANLAAMAQVAATGASILGTIRGSNFSGAYDEGGMIPAGKIGIVGEYGPEFVKGPANVTSRKDTAQILQEAGAGQRAPAAPQTNLRIVNAFDTQVIGDYMGSDQGEEVIMNVVRRNQGTVRQLAGGG